MDFFRLAVLFSFIGLSINNQAHASADPLAAVTAALNARNKAIVDVSGPNGKSVSQWALNTVVGEGIRALRENGDAALANQSEKEWDGLFVSILIDSSERDLGDHKPLFQWLADFYTKLEDRLGSNFIYNGVIGDVYQMNFAIPVVFSPKGKWRTPTTPNRDWVEYRKHFIPFANVITYWGTYLACQKITAGQDMGDQGKKLCKTVSEKLRHAMGRHVAPKISDFIFNKANGLNPSLNITQEDLVYTDAASILNEVERDGGVL
jgi:hypothetical protein